MEYSIRPANFLEQYRVDKKRPSHRGVIFFVLLAACVVFIVGALSLRSLVGIAEKTQRAKDHLLYSVDLAHAQQFALAKTHVGNARTLLHGIQSDLRPWRVMVIIPLLGRQVRAFDATIVTIDRLSIALERALTFADTAVKTIVGGKPLYLDAITREQKRLFLAQLFQSGPVLQGIKADVDLAALSLARIPDRLLVPQLREVVTPLKKQLPRLQHTLTAALPLLEALPLISGYPNPQRYLFLFQNNDELRPTGGFIGTYGILELRDGDIESLFTDNIYRLDRIAERSKRLLVEPPPPVKRHLNVRHWFLRDVNWSPDFPTTARQALWFYQKESNDRRPIDGVLAITPTIVGRFLKLLGPIVIDTVQFTPENFVDTLQFHVEKGYVDVGLPDVERKEIIGKVTKELVQRILSLPLEKLPDLFDIVEGALRERHVLLYETNADLQRLAVSEGWDGGVRASEKDFLMLVDAISLH